MRFSIRDLLWATLVVAMGLGWWVDRTSINERRVAAHAQTIKFREALENAGALCDQLAQLVPQRVRGPWRHVQWSLLDEPLVEP
jgi:hypothetical protein